MSANGHTIHLGHFALDAVDGAGNVRAGCHEVAWEEIERVATSPGGELTMTSIIENTCVRIRRPQLALVFPRVQARDPLTLMARTCLIRQIWWGDQSAGRLAGRRKLPGTSNQLDAQGRGRPTGKCFFCGKPSAKTWTGDRRHANTDNRHGRQTVVVCQRYVPLGNSAGRRLAV